VLVPEVTVLGVVCSRGTYLLLLRGVFGCWSVGGI
jgi:hypothetical protein